LGPLAGAVALGVVFVAPSVAAAPETERQTETAERLETDDPAADDPAADHTAESTAPSDGSPASDVQEPSPDATDTGHGGQFGLRVGFVAGYRMMFRYAESPFCGPPASEEGESCNYGAPPASDFALSFAPLDALELFAWARFGLARETKTDTDAVRAFGAGVRLYTMSDAPLKVFVQPAVAWSFEGGGQDPRWRARGGTVADYRSDLLLHFSVGPHYDFNRYLGMYAGAGMTVGALRALSATLEGTIGVQGRYP
jgi:hypothetical protein